MNKKKVLLRAPLLSLSGYGNHARQVFKYLLKQGDRIDLYVETLGWGACSWLLDKHMYNGLIGKIMDHSKPIPGGKADVAIQLQLPNEWDPNKGYKNVGMTALVETDICNLNWLHAMNRMDMVIVPSNHTKETITRTGFVLKPIQVVPESYQEGLETSTETKILTDLETDFNFLVFGQITSDQEDRDRKNLFKTMKYFCDVFKSSKDVGVVIKTNTGRNCAADRERTTKLLQAYVNRYRGNNQYPRFYLLHGDLSVDELGALYRHPQIKAIANFARGEGYGLPLLEAAVCDLPVIATNWSGHLDYLNHGKFLKVDYELKNVPNQHLDGNIFVPNSKWAEVKEHSVKKTLNDFYLMSDKPKEWACELGKIIRDRYNQAEIEKQYHQVLGSVLE